MYLYISATICNIKEFIIHYELLVTSVTQVYHLCTFLKNVWLLSIFVVCSLHIYWYTAVHNVNIYNNIYHRQQGQDTKEEVVSRDLRSELESRERESKEKKDSKTRSFTG